MVIYIEGNTFAEFEPAANSCCIKIVGVGLFGHQVTVEYGGHYLVDTPSLNFLPIMAWP